MIASTVLTQQTQNGAPAAPNVSVPHIEPLPNLQDFAESPISKAYICPISLEIMFDPVMASDGYIYEKEKIEEWFRDHDTSPMKVPLLNKTLTPALSVRSAIQEFLQTHPQMWEKVYSSPCLRNKLLEAVQNKDKNGIDRMISMDPRLLAEVLQDKVLGQEKTLLAWICWRGSQESLQFIITRLGDNLTNVKEIKEGREAELLNAAALNLGIEGIKLLGQKLNWSEAKYQTELNKLLTEGSPEALKIVEAYIAIFPALQEMKDSAKQKPQEVQSPPAPSQSLPPSMATVLHQELSRNELPTAPPVELEVEDYSDECKHSSVEKTAHAGDTVTCANTSPALASSTAGDVGEVTEAKQPAAFDCAAEKAPAPAPAKAEACLENAEGRLSQGFMQAHAAKKPDELVARKKVRDVTVDMDDITQKQLIILLTATTERGITCAEEAHALFDILCNQVGYSCRQEWGKQPVVDMALTVIDLEETLIFGCELGELDFVKWCASTNNDDGRLCLYAPLGNQLFTERPPGNFIFTGRNVPYRWQEFLTRILIGGPEKRRLYENLSFQQLQDQYGHPGGYLVRAAVNKAIANLSKSPRTEDRECVLRLSEIILTAGTIRWHSLVNSLSNTASELSGKKAIEMLAMLVDEGIRVFTNAAERGVKYEETKAQFRIYDLYDQHLDFTRILDTAKGAYPGSGGALLYKNTEKLRDLFSVLKYGYGAYQGALEKHEEMLNKYGDDNIPLLDGPITDQKIAHIMQYGTGRGWKRRGGMSVEIGDKKRVSDAKKLIERVLAEGWCIEIKLPPREYHERKHHDEVVEAFGSFGRTGEELLAQYCKQAQLNLDRMQKVFEEKFIEQATKLIPNHAGQHKKMQESLNMIWGKLSPPEQVVILQYLYDELRQHPDSKNLYFIARLIQCSMLQRHRSRLVFCYSYKTEACDLPRFREVCSEFAMSAECLEHVKCLMDEGYTITHHNLLFTDEQVLLRDAVAQGSAKGDPCAQLIQSWAAESAQAMCYLVNPNAESVVKQIVDEVERNTARSSP